MKFHQLKSYNYEMIAVGKAPRLYGFLLGDVVV